MQKEFQRKETIPNYKWCLCMIRFPTTASQVALAIQMGVGEGYHFLLFIVALNPFGIQFMSKNRLDCVLHKSFCKQITFDATKNTFLVLVRVFI